MKAIAQRNLPLETKYFLIDKKYIPLENSSGCGCDNCGRLIANIATVKSEEGKIYNIGFDCLETVLMNNNILEGKSVEEYKEIKKMLPKIIRFGKELKATIEEYNINRQERFKLNALKFEVKDYEFWGTHFKFHYLFADGRKENTYKKIKDINPVFCVETLKNILPSINIQTT